MTELNKNLFNFDSDSLSDVNFDEIQAEVDQMKDGKYIDEPGLYSLTVQSVSRKEAKNPVEGWMLVDVVFEDPNGKTIKEKVTVPLTVNLRYPTKTGKNELWAIKKLQAFAAGLGIDLRGAHMFRRIAEMFGDSEALVGKSAKVRIGYETSTYSEPYGEKGVALISAGKPVLDASGDILNFPSRQDAEVYAVSVLKKKYSAFMRVLEFIPATTAEAAKNAPTLGF